MHHHLEKIEFDHSQVLALLQPPRKDQIQAQPGASYLYHDHLKTIGFDHNQVLAIQNNKKKLKKVYFFNESVRLQTG
jgi:hypothetical protein